MLLVLGELVANVRHRSRRATMVVDHVWHLRLIEVLAMRRRGDVERLHALLEVRADTAAHLLWSIHMVWLDSATEALLSSEARYLARAERRIVLQL